MKVILCEDVDNLGVMGDTVNVAPGYARNFLLPRKLAVAADSASAKQIEHEMRIIKKREIKRREELAELAKGVEGIVLEFAAKAGEEGKLFGSITTIHIAEQLQELGQDVDRKKIELEAPIKSTGDHRAVIKFGHGVETEVKIVVKAEAVPEAEAAESEEPTEAPPEIPKVETAETAAGEESPDEDVARS